ncbi:hypothetical protein HELRODRAFT_165920 [Helobdella robusta]|uniref:G-protein coupled receptors family 1 profile domain-containing protein n=1 Tax=Helobdella robusta TaxID=6412 RepID=T1EXG5_HELRO|nr:hypothetical protein HELRODRAFT_165920 [Helobdella robusta]ESN90277.1 hypothetical protein HELRODRAFT_165920 [Helobdella robusta]
MYACQILFTFLPLLLLIIFNGLLIRTVMQATKLRHILTNVNTTSLNKANINASNSKTTNAETSIFGQKTSAGCKNKNVKFSDSTNDSNTHKDVHDEDIYKDKLCVDNAEHNDKETNDDIRESTNNKNNNTSMFLHPKKRKIIFRIKRNASSTIADNNDDDRCTSQSMPMITITSHSPNSTDNRFVQPNQPPQLSLKQHPQQHSPNQHQQQQHATRDQQKITIMLIIVVVVFLVCQLPQAVQKLVEVYLEPKHDGVRLDFF